MLTLLSSLKKREVEEGGTYDAQITKKEVDASDQVRDAGGLVLVRNNFLERLQQAAAVHAEESRAVALEHDSAVTAALLYPTDGKVHKFSKKQQVKGHFSAKYNSGVLPTDLYITPRDIEEDTVGSSFDDPDECGASKAGENGWKCGLEERGVEEKKFTEETRLGGSALM